MRTNRRKSVITTAVLAGLLLPGTAFAYVGPGVGLSALGTILSLVAAFLLAIVGFVWYPVRRLMRRKRQAEPATASMEQERPTSPRSATNK